MFNYTKERLVIDELIKDRNKLAKGVYTNEEIKKEIREHKNPKTNRDYKKGK